jgi:hypothetical protein
MSLKTRINKLNKYSIVKRNILITIILKSTEIELVAVSENFKTYAYINEFLI